MTECLRWWVLPVGAAKAGEVDLVVSLKYEAIGMLLTIRPAEPKDIPAMAELRAQTKGTQAFWTDRINQYLRGKRSPQKALEPRSAFIATDEEKIVGFVAGHRTCRFDCDGEVQWIDGDQQQRGRGIGYKVMAQIGAWFVSQNAKRICMNVESQVVWCEIRLG